MSTSSQTAPLYTSSQVTTLLEGAYTDDAIIAFGKWPERLTGYITFFDPGWSILRLRESAAGKGIFYPEDWYDNESFAKLEEQPRYRQLQMEAVKDSFGKTRAEQMALVPPDEEIPTARVVLMGIAIHFLAIRERLFPDYWVRCVDQISDGHLVYVGSFDPDGVGVAYWTPGSSLDALGVVLARKF